MKQKNKMLSTHGIKTLFETRLTQLMEKPLNFDPFGHARFAHLFVLYD